jgi:hypothetical protein
MGEKVSCLEFVRNAANALTFLFAEKGIVSALSEARPKPFAYLSDSNAECFSRSLLAITTLESGFLGEVFSALK